MQTFKSALRILWAHKVYMLVYLIGFGALMLSLGISSIVAAGNDTGAISANASDSATSDQTEVASKLPKAKIAVIDRDSGNLAEGLRDYLSHSATIVKLDDTPQRLQDAIARNDVDLIVVISKGYSQRFETAATSTGDDASASRSMPVADITVSYVSSQGSLAKIDVDGYFSQLRSVLASGLRTKLSDAVTYTVHQAGKQGLSPSVHVLKNAQEAGKSLASSFGTTIKLSIYPIFMAMTVCVSLLIGVFNAPETSRRLFASSARSYVLNAQELMGAVSVGLICWVLYYSAALLALAPFNSGFSAISLASLGLVALSQLVYTLISMAFGFMIGQLKASTTIANAVATSLGLMLMFTSGTAFDPSVMPAPMVSLGKLLPGWWMSVSIDDALGTTSFQTPDPSLLGWLQSLGLVALFGLAFISIGLAAGKYRHAHPESGMSNRITQLTELG
ncbi:MAG: ABC transporter permease [Bifidobacterium sp.]|uniref:ABC transporter permease n=1 Tax=Bifidobacterium sp. TaxID=41200 RepID=UPI0039E88EE3